MVLINNILKISNVQKRHKSAHPDNDHQSVLTKTNSAFSIVNSR